jgi:hypothetical protein
MKRWWWVLAAIALFFVGDRVGAALLGQLLDRSPQRFSRLYAGKLAGDIALAGNSRGVVDLHAPTIAEVTGTSAVNISHNGQTGQIARAIVEDFLELSPKPKLLVIEVSLVTSETTEAGVLEYMPYWSHSQRLTELGREYCHDEVIATDVTNLYQFNSELMLRSMIYLASGRSDQGSGMNATLSSALIEETRQLEPFKLEVVDDELVALADLVKAAQDVGVEVRLVFAPYLPMYAEKIINLDDVIRAVSDATGLKVFDFSRAIPDENLFADRVHLNPTGSRELIRLMQEAGVFEVAAANGG